MRWMATTSLIRALCLAALGLGMAVAVGDPTPLVVVAPFTLLVAMGLLTRPRAPLPEIYTRIDHPELHEGQGTRTRLVFATEPEGVEHVARVAVPAEHVALHPADGNLGYLASADPVPAIEVSPRRWGTRHVGSEYVGLTSPWSGFRAGPGKLTGLMRQGGPEMHVLPQPAPFDARAAVPQPLGLVGQHRSRRTGDGSEFASIWPYRPGDRLRRGRPADGDDLVTARCGLTDDVPSGVAGAPDHHDPGHACSSRRMCEPSTIWRGGTFRPLLRARRPPSCSARRRRACRPRR